MAKKKPQPPMPIPPSMPTQGIPSALQNVAPDAGMGMPPPMPAKKPSPPPPRKGVHIMTNKDKKR